MENCCIFQEKISSEGLKMTSVGNITNNNETFASNGDNSVNLPSKTEIMKFKLSKIAQLPSKVEIVWLNLCKTS